jgi:hypothetical protein
VQGSDLSEGTNSSTAALALEQIGSLHQTLMRAARGADKSQAMTSQISQEIGRLEVQARKQREVLGVYRVHSNFSRAQALRSTKDRQLAQERRTVLLSMDHLWWQLRDKFDNYLDLAEEEVSSVQSSIAELANYEQCTAGFSNLAVSYTRSMKAMQRSHRQLQSTWRQASNLLGELASVIADGEVFSTFIEDEGCNSTLAQQTLMQARSATAGMKMLLHRFRVSHLRSPDTVLLEEAVDRIKKAYASAKRHCVAPRVL